MLSARIPQQRFLYVRQHLGKGLGIRIGRRERQPYPPGRALDPRCDLQPLQPKRRALGAGEVYAFSAEPSKRLIGRSLRAGIRNGIILWPSHEGVPQGARCHRGCPTSCSLPWIGNRNHVGTVLPATPIVSAKAGGRVPSATG